MNRWFSIVTAIALPRTTTITQIKAIQLMMSISTVTKSKKHEQYERHSKVITNDEYSCKIIASLASIMVLLFDVFPGIHKTHALWAKQTHQGEATLTLNNRILVYRQAS